MSIEDKIKIIKDKQDTAIAAINLVLDDYLELVNPFYNNNNEFVPNEKIQKDKDFVKFITSIKEKEIPLYENLRKKLMKKDFNLSLLEINYIILAFKYTIKIWETRQHNLVAATTQLNNIITELEEQTNN